MALTNPPDVTTGGWTPTLEGQAVAGTHTYSNRVGRYTKIGNTVFIKFRITLTALDGAAAGNALITGLPFTSDPTSGTNGSAMWGLISNVGFPAGKTQMNGIVDVNTDRISIYAAQDGAGVANVVVTDFANNSNIIGAAWYDVA